MTVTDASAAPTHPHLNEFLGAYGQDPRHAGGDGSVDLSSVAARMQIRSTPFAHGVVNDFLPEDLYEDLVTSWPGHDVLAPVDLPSGGRYVGSRHAHLLEKGDGHGSPVLSTHPWATVRDAMRSPRLLAALAGRFPDPLEDNLAALAAADHPTATAFKLWVNQDEGNSEALGAHVDDLHKILTIVLYVQLSGATDSASPRRWGTALYDGASTAVAPLAFSANAAHEPLAHVEFEPNRAFVMPNCATALHGVAGGQDGVTRATVMCGYWLTTGTTGAPA